jgi:hypothetical protein
LNRERLKGRRRRRRGGRPQQRRDGEGCLDSMEGAGEELQTRRGLHASECSSGCRHCDATRAAGSTEAIAGGSACETEKGGEGEAGEE